MSIYTEIANKIDTFAEVKETDPILGYFKHGGWGILKKERKKDRDKITLNLRDFSHVFRGRKYRVKFGRINTYGTLGKHYPTRRLIYIHAWQDDVYALETLIHEALHACFNEKKEKAITDSAKSIARLLLKTGWRRKKNKK